MPAAAAGEAILDICLENTDLFDATETDDLNVGIKATIIITD